jgi:selenocysteine lyase/cysteine desulfurase
MFRQSAAPIAVPPNAGGPDDEPFWRTIRAQFELESDRVNFVTTVRGVTTRAIRELIDAENQSRNRMHVSSGRNLAWKQEVRRKVAAFIGARPDEVALLRNTTEGVTTVLLHWPLRRGDEILTSSAEHGPFYDTLAYRAARDGVESRRFHYPTPAASPDAIVEAIDRAMTARTKLVMIGRVVLTGQITPVRAIADRVHARGARLLVDGVLGIGHVPTDVAGFDCDFYAAGFHKWGCGPRGTAVFYVKPDLVARLPPLFGRFAEDEHGLGRPSWNTPTMAKFEVFGAHPESHFFALGDAVDFLASIGADRIHARLFALTSRWVARAQRLPQFRTPVTLDPSQCGGLAAWELAGVETSRVRRALTDHRLLVGGTESYAGFFGIPLDHPRSLFIANAGIFTSIDDVDRLADAIETAAQS